MAHRSLIIFTNFDGGNGCGAREVAPDCWEINLHGDVIYGSWYYVKFRETANCPREACLIIKGIPQIESVISQADRPVYQINEDPWRPFPYDQVEVINANQSRYFEEPIVWFWEKEKPVPPDRQRKYLTSNVHIHFRVPAKGSIRIAATYPYQYERLLELINRLTYLKTSSKAFCQVDKIGKSEEGRAIPMITLTDPSVPSDSKQIFLITARHHPAMESSGSWVVEGIIDYLLSLIMNSIGILAKWVIVFIPMVNVDGVFHGNPHYNIKGIDLWMDYGERKSPEVKAVFAAMERLKADFFVDLHGWICHHEGKPPYDGAYLDIKNSEPWDSTHYQRMGSYFKKNIEGFGTRDFYESLFPNCSVGTIYWEMHTLGGTLEINPGGYTIPQVQKRGINNFLKILELMDKKWDGYPGPGVPNREILCQKDIALFAWGNNYRRIRESRVELWRKRKDIKITVEDKIHTKRIIVKSTVPIERQAALRIPLGESHTFPEVRVNGKDVIQGVITQENWIFVPLFIHFEPTIVEIKR